MGKLLASDCFSSFLLKEAGIHSYVPFTIDGHINREFFEEDDADKTPVSPHTQWNAVPLNNLPWNYVPWDIVRPTCFDLIKGKRTPTSFQFILYLKPESMEAIFTKEDLSPADFLIQNLILNIRFDKGDLHLTTAVDYSGFNLDKSGEQLWDLTVRKFLSKKEIDFE